MSDCISGSSSSSDSSSSSSEDSDDDGSKSDGGSGPSKRSAEDGTEGEKSLISSVSKGVILSLFFKFQYKVKPIL